MNRKVDIAKFLDFANHHNNSTRKDIEELCQKVLKYGFNSAFVNPFYVRLAKSFLSGRAKVGTVVSFPLGQEMTSIKAESARQAVAAGADEVDVCLNVGLIKDALWDDLFSEMKEVVQAAKGVKESAVVKFIPEVTLLTPEEIKRVAVLMADSGADFFKTNSGSVGGSRGPQISDIKLVREAVGQRLRIKVVGGISTYEQAIKFIEGGADRIGTSHAVEIVEGQPLADGHPAGAE